MTTSRCSCRDGQRCETLSSGPVSVTLCRSSQVQDTACLTLGLQAAQATACTCECSWPISQSVTSCWCPLGRLRGLVWGDMGAAGRLRQDHVSPQHLNAMRCTSSGSCGGFAAAVPITACSTGNESAQASPCAACLFLTPRSTCHVGPLTSFRPAAASLKPCRPQTVPHSPCASQRPSRSQLRTSDATFARMIQAHLHGVPWRHTRWDPFPPKLAATQVTQSQAMHSKACPSAYQLHCHP